jgi:hypothetical protein
VVSHGSQAPPVRIETVHTTQKHPWLTTRGWIRAGQLRLGDQVQQLDGTTATVRGLKIIAGTAAMYDLTVSHVHTFAVGDGQFVVHNCPQVGSGDNSIKWSSGTVRSAARDLDNGATEVTGSTRSEAEEFFLRKFQAETDETGELGYRNTTGMSGPEVRDYYGSKEGTYHWDTEIDPETGGVQGHGPGNPHMGLPHLQIHPFGGEALFASSSC